MNERPTMSSDLDIPLPPCTCGAPPEPHHMATHFVRAEPPSGPMRFARADARDVSGSSGAREVVYVDHDPLIPTHLGTDAFHVHVRTTDRCLRNQNGALCLSPAELRGRVAALEAEVERLRGDLERETTKRRQLLTASGGSAAEARLDAVLGLAEDAMTTGERWIPTDHLVRALDSDATASEPTVERITDTSWDEVGGPMWLDREHWGIVIDALDQHRGHADDRKAANPESNSDVTARMCAELIQRINAAAAHLPTRQPVERITDDRGDELEHGADTDAEADQPQPMSEAGKTCVCGHRWDMHGAEAPGCVECRCRLIHESTARQQGSDRTDTSTGGA